ncbi:MAG: indolepyruvate oxidoreductase subunit beta [Planctomycetota bacterium]|jgi:indolepyruvate ferredoxin oxidoreductase beta subunit
MKCDIVLCGVGGQGILSIATVIDIVAMNRGLELKQAEVHGMAQRGGAVQSHLRIADGPIASDLVPLGSADLVLSVEPMETLRYLDYLDEGGAIVSSTIPFVNIPDYPSVEEVLDRIRECAEFVLIDSKALAKEAGNARAENTVMLGAASPFLPVPADELRKTVGDLFASKGEKVADANRKAFDLGREAALAKA